MSIPATSSVLPSSSVSVEEITHHFPGYINDTKDYSSRLDMYVRTEVKLVDKIKQFVILIFDKIKSVFGQSERQKVKREWIAELIKNDTEIRENTKDLEAILIRNIEARKKMCQFKVEFLIQSLVDSKFQKMGSRAFQEKIKAFDNLNKISVKASIDFNVSSFVKKFNENKEFDSKLVIALANYYKADIVFHESTYELERGNFSFSAIAAARFF